MTSLSDDELARLGAARRSAARIAAQYFRATPRQQQNYIDGLCDDTFLVRELSALRTYLERTDNG